MSDKQLENSTQTTQTRGYSEIVGI